MPHKSSKRKKNSAEAVVVRYSLANSKLGRLLVARTGVGICAVAFGDDDEALQGELAGRYPGARIEHADAALQADVAAVLAQLDGAPPDAIPRLDLRGTEFQQLAWAAMQQIPRGETVTYQELAAKLGVPGGQVAVGQTCARNPVAVLVPCHRVLAHGNRAHHWRWGVERKRQLLEMERRQTGKSPSIPHPEQGQLSLGQLE